MVLCFFLIGKLYFGRKEKVWGSEYHILALNLQRGFVVVVNLSIATCVMTRLTSLFVFRPRQCIPYFFFEQNTYRSIVLHLAQLYQYTVEVKQLTAKLNEANQQIDTLSRTTLANRTLRGTVPSPTDVGETTITRVCQRVKEEIDDADGNPNDRSVENYREIGDVIDANNTQDSYEIWALIEYETTTPDNDSLSPLLSTSQAMAQVYQWIGAFGLYSTGYGRTFDVASLLAESGAVEEDGRGFEKSGGGDIGGVSEVSCKGGGGEEAGGCYSEGFT